MTHLTHNMTSNERGLFRKRKALFENLAIIDDAMLNAGIKSVETRSTLGSDEQSLVISVFMDWQYTVDPEHVGNPVLTLQFGRDFDGDLITKDFNLNDALRIVSTQALNYKSRGWDYDLRGRMAVRFTQGAATNVFVDRVNEPCLQRNFPLATSDVLLPLYDKKSVCLTDAGNWIEIKTAEEASAIGHLGQTAVGHFFEAYSTGANEPVRWFALLANEGPHPKAVVTMAARPSENLVAEAWPQGSHVTGYLNANAYLTYESAINTLALQEGLHVRPNWMGNALPQPVEYDGGMQP